MPDESNNDRIDRLETKFETRFSRIEQSLTTIAESSVRVEARFESLTALLDERWQNVQRSIDFGDKQSSQAITMLHDTVKRLEDTQSKQGEEIRSRDDLPDRVAAMEDWKARHVVTADGYATAQEERIRRLEDAFTSARAVLLAAVGLGMVGGGGIAAALLKVFGG